MTSGWFAREQKRTDGPLAIHAREVLARWSELVRMRDEGMLARKLRELGEDVRAELVARHASIRRR